MLFEIYIVCKIDNQHVNLPIDIRLSGLVMKALCTIAK